MPNSAEALVEMLAAYGTRVIFGLPGDTSIGLYDALRARRSQITHIMARDERSAAFMADVYARLTGKPGICEGPSGGGATYMLPGVVEAHQSSVPFIAITTDNPQHYAAQGALTDLDQSALFASVTKWTATVTSSAVLPHMVRRAFRLATSGRPGAVHLSLPKDVLAQECRGAIFIEDACRVCPSYRTRPSTDGVQRVARLLKEARRPVIVAGGGIHASNAYTELRALAQALRAPVATTINGKGAVAETEPLSLGVIGGNGGRPYANRIVREADLVLFVGCKVNYVDTDNWTVPNRNRQPSIIQIDVDPAEIGNNYRIDEGLCGDATLALADVLDALRREGAVVNHDAWGARCTELKTAWRSNLGSALSDASRPIHPRRVVAELQRALPDGAVIVCDPGTPTPFMAAEYELRQAGRWFIAPRAQGGLGYAIPGVVGARLALPHMLVVGLCGDGSFAMSAGDLATVARVGGPTVLILFNNGSYGWIKALQKLYCQGRYMSVDFTEPLSYVRVAEGFGIRARHVIDPDALGPALAEAIAFGGPYLIEIVTAAEDVAMPPVAQWERLHSSP